MFVDAGYDKTQMTVEPIGLRVQAFDADEIYLFDRYTGVVYNCVGDIANTAGYLQHSIYNNTLVSAAGSGTDYTTGKQWSVTSGDDVWILYEENTKQSWIIKKGTGGKNAHIVPSSRIGEFTQSLWAQTEWMRHRMAISSGISTDNPNGTYGEIQILNSSGTQAAVGEDMYFWIKNDSDVLVDTGILAKYNKNNRHNVNSASLTQSIADAIYDRQIANGINMDDTGVNSSSKPVLAPGSKGTEVIAVDGEWKIITPFVSYSSATNIATAGYNMTDSPAIYWAIGEGVALPSDRLLSAMYMNKTIVNSTITYLRNREGRNLSITAVPTGNNIWTSIPYSASTSLMVYYGVGTQSTGVCYGRYYTVGATIP